jgi:membrane associated rhomboid family serine protease
MARNTAEFGLPPFRGAVRQIVLLCAAIYVFILLAVTFAPGLGHAISLIGTLDPARVRQGWVWQFITYPFIGADPWQFAVSLSGIYFIGASVESRIGSGRFWGLFLGGSALAGIGGFLLSLTGTIAQGPALTVGAATNAILMIFYLQNRNAPVMAFFVLQIPIKWLVLFIGALEAAYMMVYHFALFYVVLLLGLGAGYVWNQLFLVRRAPTVGISERYFGFRNSYYRWKRKRAARKFEVYMRQHDRTVHFDEHGNYIPPDDDKKNGGGKSGWVN